MSRKGLLLPSVCSRASLKIDAFEKNLIPIATLVIVFPRLGETGSTQDILNLLATRST
jgi:hypothetical protein